MPGGCRSLCGGCRSSQATARRNILCQHDAKGKSGKEGMEKRFCIMLCLLCLGWKRLSLCPSRQPSDSLEIVPSSFLRSAEAETVCYGRCQGAQRPTGRKVLCLKKKKKEEKPKPPLELGSKQTWILFQALCSFWVALDKSHC